MMAVLMLIILLPNYIFGFNIGALNNLLISSCAALYIFVRAKIPSAFPIFFIVGFYGLLQILLFMSGFLDYGGDTSALSPALLRPIMLMVVVLAIVAHMLNKVELISEQFQQFCRWLIFLSTTFVLLYVFFPVFSKLHTSFYLLPEKVVLLKSAVGFFATTYFAAFSYLLCFIVVYQVFIDKPSLKDAIAIVMVSGLILFSFSKTALLCWAVLALLMPVIHSKRGWVRLFVIFLLILLSICTVYFLYPMFENLRVLISAREMIEGAGGGSNSLGERAAQIDEAVYKSMENWGLGAGLAEGILTESFIANFVYRYGLIGLFIYVMFWILVGIWAKGSLKVLSGSSAVLMKSLIWWQICLPIVSLSNPVLEMGKGAILNSMVIALISANLIRVSQLKNTDRRGIHEHHR